MNIQEHKVYQAKIKKSVEKVISSKEKSQAFLKRAGIHDKNGDLSKNYRSAN